MGEVTPFAWGDIEVLFEGAGEVKFVGVADHGGGLGDGVSEAEDLLGALEAVLGEVFLDALAVAGFEAAEEVASFDAEVLGDAIDRDRLHIVILDVAADHGDFVGGRFLCTEGIVDDIVDDRGVGAGGTFAACHELTEAQEYVARGGVDRFIRIKSTGLRACESDPDVVPRVIEVGGIGCALVRADDEDFALVYGMLAAGIAERALAREAVVDKIVTADIWSEAVPWRTYLLACEQGDDIGKSCTFVDDEIDHIKPRLTIL